MKHTKREKVFVVPDPAVKYILLQRTSLQAFSKLAHRMSLTYYPHMCWLESVVRRDRVNRGFIEQIWADYESIWRHLPASVSRILDIGCGVAGIDVALYEHYGRQPNIEFLLVDRNEVGRSISYGFRDVADSYNSLDVTKLMLVSNGVDEGNVSLINAIANCVPDFSGTDLVISLLSWGFHYPVSVYLDRVYGGLRDGGVVILDVREGTRGEDELRKRFRDLTVISSGEQRQRILLRKGA